MHVCALARRADLLSVGTDVRYVPLADIQPFIEAVNQRQELTRVLCVKLPFRSELPPGGGPV
jgi:hypothetical protein